MRRGLVAVLALLVALAAVADAKKKGRKKAKRAKAKAAAGPEVEEAEDCDRPLTRAESYWKHNPGIIKLDPYAACLRDHVIKDESDPSKCGDPPVQIADCYRSQIDDKFKEFCIKEYRDWWRCVYTDCDHLHKFHGIPESERPSLWQEPPDYQDPPQAVKPEYVPEYDEECLANRALTDDDGADSDAPEMQPGFETGPEKAVREQFEKVARERGEPKPRPGDR